MTISNGLGKMRIFCMGISNVLTIRFVWSNSKISKFFAIRLTLNLTHSLGNSSSRTYF